jgi:predicted amidohydrolase
VTADSFRLGIAQPRAVPSPDAEKNVALATELVAKAAARGAQLVLFPEGFPGPLIRSPLDEYEAAPAMAAAAAKQGIGVCWSRTERCEDGKYRLVVYVVGEDGVQILRYERVHPATLPPHESKVHVAPGNDLGMFDLDGVAMGIVVCSELWIPEPTRVLAIRGAEVILSPAGGGFTSLTENWKTIVRARAIENSAYVALTNNIWAQEEGAAMIAGPEQVIAASGSDDLIVADLDLGRSRWLRNNDDSLAEPKPFDSIPGLVRFRRPELYGDLAAPANDTFDFHTNTEAIRR